MMRWGMWASLVGCGGGASHFDPDVVNGRLLEGSSLCEYESVAPAFPAADASGPWAQDWERSPYLPCADGALSVRHTTFDSGSGRSVRFTAEAQLFEVVTPFSSSPMPRVLDPSEGVDDCEVLRLEAPLAAAEVGEVVFLDAGAVSLDIAGWQSPLVDLDPDSSALIYGVALSEGEIPGEIEAGRGSVSLLVWEGGAAPAMDLSDLTEVPPSLEVSEPPLTWGTVLPRQDVPFRWTGTGDVLTISLFVRESYKQPSYPQYQVRCEVADDGEWVLPASVSTQLPAGWQARVEVERRRVDWMGTMNGLAVQTDARSAHVGANLTLGE